LFEQFWAIYPRRIGKGSARTAFAKAAAKVIPETILQIAEQYAGKSDLPDLQFIPHPTTWLNQERWNDDLSASGKFKRKHKRSRYFESRQSVTANKAKG